jgi:hypothetical protein
MEERGNLEMGNSGMREWEWKIETNLHFHSKRTLAHTSSPPIFQEFIATKPHRQHYPEDCSFLQFLESGTP